MPIDDSTNHRNGSPVAIAFAVVFFLLLSYILSPGPVLWLLTQANIAETDPAGKCVLAVYAPLIWLYEKFTVVHSVYDWYFSLFGVR